MMKQYPVHRSLVAVDIEGYSRRRNQGHMELREALRRILADAFDSVGVEIVPTEQQDQGDAFLTLVRPEVSKVVLVDGLVREMENALRRYNHYHTEEGKMRLRVALHAGEVHLDGTGFPGEATVMVMRLIEAEQVKNALAKAPKDLAVIVSDGLYRDVVAHDYGGIVHEEYGQVEVAVKTFRGPAWIRVPGCPAVDTVPDAPVVTPSGTSPGGGGTTGTRCHRRSREAGSPTRISPGQRASAVTPPAATSMCVVSGREYVDLGTAHAGGRGSRVRPPAGTRTGQDGRRRSTRQGAAEG